jgi:hypothetical protein
VNIKPAATTCIEWGQCGETVGRRCIWCARRFTWSWWWHNVYGLGSVYSPSTKQKLATISSTHCELVEVHDANRMDCFIFGGAWLSSGSDCTVSRQYERDSVGKKVRDPAANERSIYTCSFSMARIRLMMAQCGSSTVRPNLW